jgi:hypothetical protein
MVFGPHERFVRHLGMVLAFYTVPNEFGLDRWLIDYQEAGRSAGLRPLQDATRAMAMLSFTAADFDVDYRDVVAQKRLLRERMAGFGWLTPRILAHLDDWMAEHARAIRLFPFHWNYRMVVVLPRKIVWTWQQNAKASTGP